MKKEMKNKKKALEMRVGKPKAKKKKKEDIEKREKRFKCPKCNAVRNNNG